MANISARITDDVHEKLKSHPLRHKKTLAEFYQHIFEVFLDLPESRLACKEDEPRKALWRNEVLEYCMKHLREQNSTSKPGVAASASQPQPAEPSPASATPSPDDPEGDFVAVIRNAAADETPSSSAVDLMFAVASGPAQGKTFVDRFIEFPPGPGSARTVYLKRALGLDPAASIIRNRTSLIGKEVLVRRTKNPDASGPRMLTFYYLVPQTIAH